MRRVLVTGASKGIGQATAIMLANNGFHVTVHYHSDQAGAQTTLTQVEQTGGKGELCQFDIADRAQCAAVLQELIKQHGAFYAVVNNAGICQDGAFPMMSGETWDAVVHTNLDSFYNVLHPCIMPMIQAKQGGRIVTLSSVSGVMGNFGQVNYSAAKAGIIGATKALAVELAKRKITVNCVAPGLIDTDMISGIEADMEQMIKHVPLRRVGQANEVASLINYLLSDAAAYITRQVIAVNGGLI